METQVFYFNDNGELVVIPDNGRIVNTEAEMPVINGEFKCSANTLEIIMNILANKDVCRYQLSNSSYIITRNSFGYDNIIKILEQRKEESENLYRKTKDNYECMKKCIISIYNAPWYKRVSKKYWRDVVSQLRKFI